VRVLGKLFRRVSSPGWPVCTTLVGSAVRRLCSLDDRRAFLRVIYLHDFGSPIGARLAIIRPQRVVAQIIQNGDIPYEDALGPKY